MSVASPLLILTVVGALLALALVWRDERRRAIRLGRLVTAGLVPALVAGASPGRRRLRAVLGITAVVAATLGAMGPLWPGTPRLLPRQGLDILFVVDVSRSMRARDVRPDRLDRAKAELSAAVDHLAEHRLGLVAFAGSAFVQCPLTTDVEAFRLFLGDLSPEAVPQGGSALDAGLEVALNAFLAEDEARGTTGGAPSRAGRVVVVVSDGEDHDLLAGGDLDALGKRLEAVGAKVVVIGVGSTLGEPIPILNKDGSSKGYLRDRTGQTVVSRMSPEVLEKVATSLGGRFVDGTHLPELGFAEVQALVAGLEKRELEARTVTDTSDASWPFAVVAIISSLLWLLLPERPRTIRTPARTTSGRTV